MTRSLPSTHRPDLLPESLNSRRYRHPLPPEPVIVMALASELHRPSLCRCRHSYTCSQLLGATIQGLNEDIQRRTGCTADEGKAQSSTKKHCVRHIHLAGTIITYSSVSLSINSSLSIASARCAASQQCNWAACERTCLGLPSINDACILSSRFVGSGGISSKICTTTSLQRIIRTTC